MQVACMQFINIVVHSVEDMNFRVHLQYEFSQLGIDDYLEKLRHHESEELQVSFFYKIKYFSCFELKIVVVEIIRYF